MQFGVKYNKLQLRQEVTKVKDGPESAYQMLALKTINFSAIKKLGHIDI